MLGFPFFQTYFNHMLVTFGDGVGSFWWCQEGKSDDLFVGKRTIMSQELHKVKEAGSKCFIS